MQCGMDGGWRKLRENIIHAISSTNRKFVQQGRREQQVGFNFWVKGAKQAAIIQLDRVSVTWT
jgi:high-affinity nickel permease